MKHCVVHRGDALDQWNPCYRWRVRRWFFPAGRWGRGCQDYLSVGVIAQIFPLPAVRAALDECGRRSQRQRSLPAEVMMYYVIALGLFRSVSAREVLRCLVDGLRCGVAHETIGNALARGRRAGDSDTARMGSKRSLRRFEAAWSLLSQTYRAEVTAVDDPVEFAHGRAA